MGGQDFSGFEDLFGRFGGGFGGFNEQRYQGRASYRGDDQHATLEVDLDVAFHGATQNVTLQIPTINAYGQAEVQRKVLKIKIPKGMKAGQKIRLTGQGQPGIHGGENGDLYIEIQYKATDSTYVENSDVYHHLKISPWEAALGQSITASLPNGKQLNIQIPKNAKTGQQLRLKNQGIPAKDGQAVYLKDIWPTQGEIDAALQNVNTEMFHKEYAEVFEGDAKWKAIQIPQSQTYAWDEQSTYIRHPPFFAEIDQPVRPIQPISQARILAVLGDSVTTDHISPAGNIKQDSPAGRYLQQQGVDVKDFNSYGSRRGNHEVMMRGTFANIRIKNEMLGGEEGGNTLHIPSAEKLSIYDVAMRYQAEQTPLLIIAGKEYGTGSSRDWAAKGTNLLGIKAVIAESFERIHRSNLVGMGVLPLQFVEGQNRQILNLSGHETLSILGLSDDIHPHQMLDVEVQHTDGTYSHFQVLCRIDTLNEVQYFKAGGILHYVLRNLLAS